MQRLEYHGQRGYVSDSMAIPDAVFSEVQICSYIVRHTQHNRLRFLLFLIS